MTKSQQCGSPVPLSFQTSPWGLGTRIKVTREGQGIGAPLWSAAQLHGPSGRSHGSGCLLPTLVKPGERATEGSTLPSPPSAPTNRRVQSLGEASCLTTSFIMSSPALHTLHGSMEFSGSSRVACGGLILSPGTDANLHVDRACEAFSRCLGHHEVPFQSRNSRILECRHAWVVGSRLWTSLTQHHVPRPHYGTSCLVQSLSSHRAVS